MRGNSNLLQVVTHACVCARTHLKSTSSGGCRWRPIKLGSEFGARSMSLFTRIVQSTCYQRRGGCC